MKEKKKILIVIPSLGVGGLERMAVNIANSYSRAGNEVTVWNLTFHDEHIRRLIDNEVNYRSSYSPIKNILKCNISDLLHLRFRILPLSEWFYLHTSQYIHKKYVKEKFDVEIAFYYGAPAHIVAGAPKSTKKVFWVHEIPSAVREKDHNLLRIKKEKLAIDAMDLAVCVSESFKTEIQNKYRCSSIITIPNLSDYYSIKEKANEAPENINKTKFTAVFVGRLDMQHKGVDRLLSAVKTLNNEGLAFDLWIIGDGSDRKKIEDILEKEHLNNVILFGAKANPYPYIKNADLLILSSRWEAYGLVMAESLILGTPVLATQCAGSVDILVDGKYGRIVENSTMGITDGLRELIQNNTLYNHYVKMAEDRMDSFRPENIIPMLEEVLD